MLIINQVIIIFSLVLERDCGLNCHMTLKTLQDREKQIGVFTFTYEFLKMIKLESHESLRNVDPYSITGNILDHVNVYLNLKLMCSKTEKA